MVNGKNEVRMTIDNGLNKRQSFESDPQFLRGASCLLRAFRGTKKVETK